MRSLAAAIVVAAVAASAASAAAPITAAPRVIGWLKPSQLAGNFAGARHDDDVVIEHRPCGSAAFSPVLHIPAAPNGDWHVFVSPTISTEYRARWRNETSQTVEVMVRPHVTLRERRRGQFSVTALAMKQFWRRSGVLERFDPRTRRWRRVKTFVFTDTGSTTGTTSYSNARFRSTVPPRSLVRVLLPTAQVRPCYAAGVSNMLRLG